MINEDTRELGKVINAFTVYKFIKLITTPFNQTEAYRLGIIDQRGKFLKKLSELETQQEKKSVDAFHRLIFNLKKIFETIPDSRLRAQLKILPTAMVLLKDEAEKHGADGDLVHSEIKEYILEETDIDLDSVEVDSSFTQLIEGEDDGR